MKNFEQYLNQLLAVPAGRGAQYIFITTAVTLLCLTWVSLISFQVVGDSVTAAPIILASMGAAAVLMFAAPGSPMAKPWAFIVGNISSAIVGVTVFQLLGESLFTGPVAVASAILVMHLLRCQHPPGGATALVAVIGGADIHALGYAYVLTPVAINVVAFLLAVIIHRRLLAYLASRDESTRMLQRVVAGVDSSDAPAPAELYNMHDIRLALQSLGTYIDVAPEQIHEVFQLSLQHAKCRVLQQQTCGEHLYASDATTEYGSSLLQAWNKMCEGGYDYLVVLDKVGKVEGKITAAAIIGLINDYPSDHFSADHPVVEDLSADALNQLLQKIISPSTNLHNYRPEVVGQLMQPIDQVYEKQPLIESVYTGLNHTVAVVDSEKRYRGCLIFT
ncbi:MAG: HPP family protein [Pseudomonadales bacterium]|nr:HPP family protein [Pseudomonadales bacterium]